MVIVQVLGGISTELITFVNNDFIMEEVVRNKSSLVLKNYLQNTQTLELFIMVIKIESIYKSC
jgi:hypothetical protein